MKKIIMLTLMLLAIACNGIAGIVMMGGGGGVPAAPPVATNYLDDANLLGAWYMNSAADGSEIDRDDTGTDYDLTEVENGDLSGNVAQSATVPSGYAGYSKGPFELGANDAALEHTTSTNLNITGNNPLSIVAWVYLNTTAASCPIVTKWASSTEQQYRIIYTSATTEFKAYIATADGSANWCTEVSNSAPSVSTWYHVAMVFDTAPATDTLTLYVNGVAQATPTECGVDYAIQVIGDPQNFCIGGYEESSTGYCNGLIDEVAIFNDALTGAEVAEIYNNGIDGDNGGND